MGGCGCGAAWTWTICRNRLASIVSHPTLQLVDFPFHLSYLTLQKLVLHLHFQFLLVMLFNNLTL